MIPIMRLLCVWGILLLCCGAYSNRCSNNPYIGPLVQTAFGALVGKYVTVFDTDVAAFLGIPYAEPPVKDNRFLKPKPLECWEGILEATEKPNPCMQFSSRNFSWIPKTTTPSEDCLYLNVWTPVKCCCTDEEKLPVLVWIHGGGFYSGSTDMDIYDGSTLAAYSKSIVVTINYRLGIFGFFSSGNEDAPGNAGLWDQHLALKWVKNNIKFFGGDTNRITIMGESAGAISVSLHMISPLSRNLFNRAIMQSATAYNPGFVDSVDVSHIKANTYAEIIGCLVGNSSVDSDPEVVQCLKNKNALELAKAEDIFTSKLPQYFLPTYGDEYLPIAPIKALNAGHIAPVDILVGNNRDEVTIFLNYIIPDVFKLDSEPQLDFTAAETIVAALFQTVLEPPSKEIVQYYFENITDGNSVEIVQAIAHAFGDYVFNCPVQFLAEKSKNNSFLYWFTHRSMLDQHANWMGVPHFYEVPYVFGVPIQNTDIYTPEDYEFSGDIIRKWSTFAQTGHPLGDKNPERWPLFTADQPTAFELNPREERNLTFPRASACEFWRPYISPETC